jgi:NADH dehydrogenase
VQVIGDGTRRFRPIHAADVVDAIINAARGIGEAGTYDLVGPTELTATDIAEMVNGHAVPIKLVPVDPAATTPGPPATVADLLTSPTPPTNPDPVARAFHLTLTRPETTWPIARSTRA